VSDTRRASTALWMLASAPYALAVFFSMASGIRAQQLAGAREVPDNVAPHPAPEQPVPFSHKAHVALGLGCEICHVNPDPGVLMAFPATGTCRSCHRDLGRDRPALARLATFAESGQEIPWVRVYRLLPGVTWAHRAHTEAGVTCGACHGDVARLDATAMTTAVTAMASCVDCHRARRANTSCETCHAWPGR